MLIELKKLKTNSLEMIHNKSLIMRQNTLNGVDLNTLYNFPLFENIKVECCNELFIDNYVNHTGLTIIKYLSYTDLRK